MLLDFFCCMSCKMALHDKRGGNRMNLGLCCCMALHDERRGNQMILELCFCSMRLHDERGEVLIKCCWTSSFV